MGGAAGIGAGLWWTNADTAKQLEGPFETQMLSIGPIEAQFSASGKTVVFSIGGALGEGAGTAHLQTNTQSW